MRIITGKAKGIHLKTLEGDATRPTSERVKEAVFSMLQFDIEGRKVLDLFAGYGAVFGYYRKQYKICEFRCDRRADGICG